MLIAFNKPWGVLSQFSDGFADAEKRLTLADFLNIPGIYPAGRLDRDSEGLLLLTDDGRLQHRIAHPDQRSVKSYLVQVEGIPSASQISRLEKGVRLKDGMARAVEAGVLPGKPGWLWRRDPPIRVRKNQPASWLYLSLSEGRNRQVRRMTAAVGLPTLRLVRVAVGPVTLDGLKPGQWREIDAAVFA